MQQLIKLSKISETGISQCQTLDVECNGVSLELILLCYEAGKYRAYVNKCPHTGVNLNWLDNQCFDSDGDLLMCSLHGALFQPDDGFCVYGPCKGQSLVSLPLLIKAGVIYLDVAEAQKLVEGG